MQQKVQNKELINWQTALSNVVSDCVELFELLELDQKHLAAASAATQLFPLRVPRGFIARMQKGDINDPLLRQVLPLGAELEAHPDFNDDPVGDQSATKLPGLIHKYHGRVLLTLSGACAVNCRYCFRRAFPYSQNLVGNKEWQNILTYIKNDTSIKEVIFSGGDPLIASDKRLANMCADLEAIPHVTTLRIHTRLPIVLPERINDALLSWMTASRLKKVIVVHCNHVNEINTEVRTALQKLHHAGVFLYNQAVVLKDINDSATRLAELQQALHSEHVQPYYLHVLDKVSGTQHFAISDAKAKQIYQDLQNLLPGYLVPKLVREEAGMGSKSLLI